MHRLLVCRWLSRARRDRPDATLLRSHRSRTRRIVHRSSPARLSRPRFGRRADRPLVRMEPEPTGDTVRELKGPEREGSSRGNPIRILVGDGRPCRPRRERTRRRTAGTSTFRDHPAYFVGTRRFSSSSKCWTTTICWDVSTWSLEPAFIIRKRWPSAETS